MNTAEVLTYFQGVKSRGANQWQCNCPAHNDKKASLSIKAESSGKTLLHCFKGCKTEEVLNAVGLEMKDICSERKESTWKERLEYSRKKKIEALYHYKAADGDYLYTKVRFEDKDISYVVIDKMNDRYSYSKGERAHVLYRLPELVKAIECRQTIYIVEGEKDVETLRTLGYAATTSGGATSWREEFASIFTGVDIVILPDHDEAGEKLRDEIIKSLTPYAHSIRWTFTSTEDKADVTDYIKKEKHTKEELNKLINASERKYAPWIYATGGKENKRLRVNAGILAENITRTVPFLIVRYPNEEKDSFYLYEDGVYKKSNRNKMKSVIYKYVPPSMVSDSLLNNVCGLLLSQGKNIHSWRDLDKDEKYINLKNGLYNVNTRKLEPHTPSVLSTRQLECNYDPAATNRRVFDKYMNDLCLDDNGNVDEEKKAIIQEYCGAVLSNVNVCRTKKAMILLSLMGNTGKSQLLKLINEILGDNASANVPIQNMNEKSKFALGGIVGTRVIIVGDQTSSEIEDSAIFKQLTGGDDIKVEQKGKQPYTYCYPGGVIIACNNLPIFKDDKGGHLFERLAIIPCINVIPKELRDSYLLDKMLKEKEAVFNWFLEGFHRLKDNNYRLTESSASDEVMGEYRSRQDTLFAYIIENYVITGDEKDRVSKSEFEKDYSKWCELNDRQAVKKRNVKDRMESLGCPYKRARVGDKAGISVYTGLKEKMTDFEAIEQKGYVQEEIPF